MQDPTQVMVSRRQQAPARCVVCDAAMPLHTTTQPYPVCHATACRMVLSRRAAMGEAGFRQFLQLHAWQVRQRAAAVRAAQARQQAEAQENADAWDALQAILPNHGVPAPLRLLLPSGPQRDSAVTPERLARYRAHLQQAALEASRMASLPAPQMPEPIAEAAGASTLPGQLCGQCGGGGCTRGGDEAYLAAPTLRRFMDAHPAAGADDVVAAYLAYVPAQAQDGARINHTGAGCTLPRALRSETCNVFACTALQSVLAAQRDDAAVLTVLTVLVVRRSQDHWRRFDAGPANAIAARTVLREGGALDHLHC
jgi:hypothetical protein